MTAPTLTRILLVEDEPFTQMVAKMALETMGGWSVQVCASGNEALEVAGTFRPDLILLDVMMPGLDGRQTYAALRRLPDQMRTPVAFMTAQTAPDEVEELRALGAIGIISKPFEPMTLAGQVREVWVDND